MGLSAAEWRHVAPKVTLCVCTAFAQLVRVHLANLAPRPGRRELQRGVAYRLSLSPEVCPIFRFSRNDQARMRQASEQYSRRTLVVRNSRPQSS